MMRLALLTLLLCASLDAQTSEVVVPPTVDGAQKEVTARRYGVTLFSIRTSDKIEPASVQFLGQGELEVDDKFDRSSDFSISDGDGVAKASLRRGFDPTGQSNTVNLTVTLERRVGLSTSVQGDSVEIDSVPVAVSVASWLRRSRRSPEEYRVAALLTEVGSKETDINALVGCCLKQLRVPMEAEPKRSGERRRVRRMMRATGDSEAGVSILARLPLHSLLSAEQLTSLRSDATLGERFRTLIGTVGGDADSLISLIKMSENEMRTEEDRRAIAAGWALATDPIARGAAGVALFKDSPETFGPLFAAEVESGKAQIPADEDAAKIMNELRVVRTWRNTTPAYLAASGVLIGAILLAMASRAALRRAVA